MSAISQLPAVTAAGTDRIPLARLSGTDVYTAGTISAAASDNSLNDSAASFPAWLLPGLRINIAAFTGDTDNNHDSATVVSATTAKVVLGADTPLVDDAAGESVTITAWESKRTTAQGVADLAATSGPSIASRYVIDLASQADSDPGAGKLRFNNATAASATKIFLDDETSDGVDLSTKLLDLGSSGYIRIQSVADVGECLVAKWTAIVDDTGYFDIAITVLASKGTIDDTDAVLVTFDAKGAAGDVSAASNLTDHAIVRGDGGAKGVQTSGVVVSDTDELSGYLAKLNQQTGTSYTVDVAGSDTDAGKIVECTNGSAIAVTLPATAPVGFACTVVQGGAGQITFASTGSGTLVNRQSHTKAAGANAMVALYVRANAGGSAAVWVMGGDTAA
jgi:hypothetical protein